MKDQQEYERKVVIAEEHHQDVLVKKWYHKLKQYQVYKILVKDWYQ